MEHIGTNIALTLLTILLLGSLGGWWIALRLMIDRRFTSTATHAAGTDPESWTMRVHRMWSMSPQSGQRVISGGNETPQSAIRGDPFNALSAVSVWVLLPALLRLLIDLPDEFGIGSVRFLCLSNLLTLLILLALISRFDRRRCFLFGLTARNWQQQCAIGIVGCLASVLPVVLVLLLSHQLRNSENQHVLFRLLRDQFSIELLSWILVTAIVTAPITEELVFRVLIQGTLAEHVPGWQANAITAATFSVFHGFPDSIALLPLALLLGVVYQNTRSWLAVIVMHMLFNTCNLVFALLTLSEMP